jgi:hypothetical protein
LPIAFVSARPSLMTVDADDERDADRDRLGREDVPPSAYSDAVSVTSPAP